MNDITKIFFERQKKNGKRIMFSIEDSSEDSLKAFSNLLKENNIKINPTIHGNFSDVCLSFKKQTNRKHLIYFNIVDEISIMPCVHPEFWLFDVYDIYPIEESYYKFPVSEKEILNLIT